jgi:hypothetical protein
MSLRIREWDVQHSWGKQEMYTKSQENRVVGIIMKSTCFIKYHGMRMYGGVDALASHILNFGTEWR